MLTQPAPLQSAACPFCGRRDVVDIAGWTSARLARCASCDLTFRDPPPYADFLRQYEEAYTDVTASAQVERARRRIFSDMLARLGAGHGRRLLDVGCATGEFMALARTRLWDTVGVEATHGGREAARRQGLRVEATTDAYPDGFVDVVTLWNVVEFFPRPLEQMQDLWRVLVPGGVLFARTPNAAFQVAAYRASRRLRWPPAVARLLGDAYHFNPLVWSGRSLRELLERAGFEEVRIRNGVTSAGDPYRARDSARQWLVQGVKRTIEAAAETAYRASTGRLLLGSSLIALARKPEA